MGIVSIIFYKLLYMSIIASAIGLSIILIRKFLSKHISPKIIYVMWMVFLLALVVPPFITTKVSVYNYIDVSALEELTKEYVVPSEVVNKEMSIEDKPAKRNEETIEKDDGNSAKNIGKTSQETKPLPNLKDLLPMLWLVGVVVSFIVYIGTSIAFKRKIGKVKFQDERIRNIFETSKEKFKVKRKIELINQSSVKSPAIVGIIKPKILLTESLKENTDSEIEYIFRHELSHFKRNDNVINPILLLLRTIHWFNPIVWVVMKEIKKDMEFTADERAVKGLEPDERKEYCKLLVNLSNNVEIGFMEKAIGIANDKNNLEKRIDMIKLSDKLSKHPVFSAMLVFVIIGLICLVLYTNNYYQPKLDVPPKLYLQTSTGKSFEMALIKYEWINGDKVSNYDIEFNPDTYEFKDENTAYVILDYEEPETYECTIYTNPKCRIAFMNENSYSNSYDGKNFIVYKNVFNDINDTKIEHQNIFNDILTYDVYFENGSMATYGVKFETYNLHKAEIFEKYADTKLSDKAKIEELVKKMRLGSFLKELRIEGNTIFLNYEYAQGEKYAYNMAEVLFVDIPELEKVVFDTIHDKVIANYYPDGVEAEATRTIEITREIVNEKTDQTIEQLQKILKNR